MAIPPGELQAHPYFYERLAYHPLSDEYVERLRHHLPTAWTLDRDDVWVHARPEDEVRLVQGFKIHVSAGPEHARPVLDVAVPPCAERGIAFKVVGDRALHFEMDSKRYARAASGKFMTIYPPDEAAFRELIEELYQRSRDEPFAGPRILSDRQYKDSPILFYRYGGFHPLPRVNIDGTHATCLLAPDGEQVVDQRVPYFRLPEWVEDPFGGSPRLPQQESVLLRDRYLIEGAFRFANSGGVYHGTDTATGEPIVMKEARPLTNCWTVADRTWDAVSLLRREHTLLRRLDDLDCVPSAIDLFTSAGHAFLVQQRVEGLDLRRYWAQDDVILAPFIRVPGRVALWAPKFRHVAESLIAMVHAVHERGVLLGDLSPDNVLFDVETGRAWFIDFESAVSEDDDAAQLKYATLWGTPGFVNPARAARDRLEPEDDWFSLAMILYSAIAPAQFLTLNPGAMSAFLDRFVALGVPEEARQVIVRLASGDVVGASSALAGWIA